MHWQKTGEVVSSCLYLIKVNEKFFRQHHEERKEKYEYSPH